MTIGTKSSKKLFKRNILKHLINFKILTVITIVCSFFLFFGGPGYYSPRSFKYLWDIGHIVFFCALSTLILLDWSTHKKMSFLRQCVAIVLIDNNSWNTDRIGPGRHKTNSRYIGCYQKPNRNIRRYLLFGSGEQNSPEIIPQIPSGPDHFYGDIGSLAICKGSRR